MYQVGDPNDTGGPIPGSVVCVLEIPPGSIDPALRANVAKQIEDAVKANKWPYDLNHEVSSNFVGNLAYFDVPCGDEQIAIDRLNTLNYIQSAEQNIAPSLMVGCVELPASVRTCGNE